MLTGTHRLCKPKLGVRFPPPPSVQDRFDSPRAGLGRSQQRSRCRCGIVAPAGGRHASPIARPCPPRLASRHRDHRARGRDERHGPIGDTAVSAAKRLDHRCLASRTARSPARTSRHGAVTTKKVKQRLACSRRTSARRQLPFFTKTQSDRPLPADRHADHRARRRDQVAHARRTIGAIAARRR